MQIFTSEHISQRCSLFSVTETDAVYRSYNFSYMPTSYIRDEYIFFFLFHAYIGLRTPPLTESCLALCPRPLLRRGTSAHATSTSTPIKWGLPWRPRCPVAPRTSLWGVHIAPYCGILSSYCLHQQYQYQYHSKCLRGQYTTGYDVSR